MTLDSRLATRATKYRGRAGGGKRASWRHAAVPQEAAKTSPNSLSQTPCYSSTATTGNSKARFARQKQSDRPDLPCPTYNLAVPPPLQKKMPVRSTQRDLKSPRATETIALDAPRRLPSRCYYYCTAVATSHSPWMRQSSLRAQSKAVSSSSSCGQSFLSPTDRFRSCACSAIGDRHRHWYRYVDRPRKRGNWYTRTGHTGPIQHTNRSKKQLPVFFSFSCQAPKADKKQPWSQPALEGWVGQSVV